MLYSLAKHYTMVMQNERGKNTHGQGKRVKRVKIPLLPNNVGKKSANNAGPQQGHDNGILEKLVICITHF